MRPPKGILGQNGMGPPRGGKVEIDGEQQESNHEQTQAAFEGQDEQQDDDDLTAAEEWYELCRETFQQIGLGDRSLDKIFCE